MSAGRERTVLVHLNLTVPPENESSEEEIAATLAGLVGEWKDSLAALRGVELNLAEPDLIHWQERVKVTVAMPVTGALVRDFDLPIHDREKCEGRPCTFHAPSDHHMKTWPVVVRLDRDALVERTCQHGVGHPDPDSLAYYESTGEATKYALGVHGCDGCCMEVADRDAAAEHPREIL